MIVVQGLCSNTIVAHGYFPGAPVGEVFGGYFPVIRKPPRPLRYREGKRIGFDAFDRDGMKRDKFD